MNKNFRFSYPLLQNSFWTLVISLVYGCSVEVTPSMDHHSTFLKMYGDSTTDYMAFVAKTSDNGILMAGGEYNDPNPNPKMLRVIKTNEFGEQLWKKHLELDQLMFTRGLKLSDGTFIFNSWGSANIVKMDADGNILFQNNFSTSITYLSGWFFSPLVQGDDGYLYCSSSNGGGTYLPSTNYLFKISPADGGIVARYLIDDEKFGGKVYYQQVYRIAHNHFWILGNLSDKIPHNFADPSKTFVAKIGFDSTKRVTIFDKDDDSEQDLLGGYVVTPDNGVVFIIAQGHSFLDNSNGTKEFELVRLDENINVIWRTRINLGTNSINPANVTYTPDGNFLVMGHCYTNGLSTNHPFMAKISADGKLLFHKIYDLLGSASFEYGIKEPNGSYLFTGYATGFGNGKTNTDPILMRTDIDGNFKQ